MKLGHQQNAGRKRDLSMHAVFTAEKRSESPNVIEAAPQQSTQRICMEEVKAGVASQRLRLNFG